MQYDADLTGKASYRFIDTVIDYFLRQMIRSARVGIHTRSFFDRFEASQYLDRSCIVVIFQQDNFLDTRVSDCAGL